MTPNADIFRAVATMAIPNGSNSPRIALDDPTSADATGPTAFITATGSTGGDARSTATAA